ncbi:MAG: hypothetical protein M0R23_08830 [Bacteroidales bacterium]|jgi:hypothetical protein|nr:hypothetical protein [Bacteroidales bacterium]
MKNTIKDRLAISSLLPREGDMVTLILARDIKKKVDLTQELMKEVNFRAEGNNFIWNEEKEPADIIFTEAEINLLKKKIQELEKSKKLLLENLDLYKKINEWKEEPVDK